MKLHMTCFVVVYLRGKSIIFERNEITHFVIVCNIKYNV